MERTPLFPGNSCFPLSPDLQTRDRRAGFPSANDDQLFKILQTIGTPTFDDVCDAISDEKARNYLVSFPSIERVSFNLKYPASDPNVLQILEATLQFNPNRRPAIKELLSHPYFDVVRNQN
jgi:mitogen-activated protein kinase 1/3